ncbi:hypothetical protein D9M68_625890 [compost metagenome]
MYHKNNNTSNQRGQIALINNALEPAFQVNINKEAALVQGSFQTTNYIKQLIF